VSAILWNLLVVYVLKVNDIAKPQVLGLVNNILAILFLSLGIREQRRRNRGTLIFGEGIVTGISIMVVFVVITNALFALTRGRLTGAPLPPDVPIWRYILLAMAVQLIGGAIISTIISFVLKRDPSQDS
jgi:hypothetical protein